MIPKLASPVEVSDTSRSHNETSSSAEEDVSVEPPAPAAQHGNQNWSSSLYVDSEGQIIIAGSLSGLPLLEQLGALHPRPTGLRADPKPVDPPLASTSRERLPGQENSLKRKRADESDTPAEEREGQEDDLDGDEEDGKPILKDGISHAEVWSLCSSVCDQDLMDKLIRQHLTKSEALHPVLHHPTFLQCYLKASGRSSEISSSGKKERKLSSSQENSQAQESADEGDEDEDDEDEAAGCSPQFGSLVMAVCAMASRSFVTEDPRVLAVASNPRSAGLKYFKMARMLLMTSSARLDIHYVQAVMYLAVFTEGFGTSATHSGYVGELASLAITTGMHRDNNNWEFDPVVSEQRKRLFWCIFNYDKAAAMSIGRPPLIRMADTNTGLPSEMEDWLITREGVEEGSKNILRTAFNHVCYYSVVSEQLLHFSNSTYNEAERPGKDFDPTQYIFNMFPKQSSAARRLASLERIERCLDQIENSTPPSLKLPADLAFPPKMSEMHIFQIIRLAIIQNNLRSLVAREQMAQELKERQEIGWTNEPLSPAAATAKTCATTVVQLFNWLDSHGMLWAYFGVPHVHQLQNAGHTLLASMCLYSGMSFEGVAHLETIIFILHQSSVRWRCALRALSVLRSMAAHFNIQLSDSAHVPSIPQAGMPWVRTLPRKVTAPQQPHSSKHQQGHEREPCISNQDWMLRTAAGDELPVAECTLPTQIGAAWQDRDAFSWTPDQNSADDIPISSNSDHPGEDRMPGTEALDMDDQESRMLFSEFGLSLNGVDEMPLPKDTLYTLLESWDSPSVIS